MANEIRTFDKSDWQGFSGALGWAHPEGSEMVNPLIAEDDTFWTIVGDAQGVLILNAFTMVGYQFHAELTPAMIRLIMSGIIAKGLANESQYEALGFERNEF